MNILAQKYIDRFWGKVNKENSNIFYNGTRCWEWTGARVQNYGQFWCGDKVYKSHRVSWAISFYPIPDGLDVCHSCDNPPCVNPSHLFLGTHKQNMEDRDRKGRRTPLRGENNGMSKLSNDQVLEIRKRYKWRGIGGENTYQLAREFGVSDVHIGRIVNNKIR